MAEFVISCLWAGTCRQEPGMQSMNISLPEPMKQYVDGQIAQGRYSSASEYVRELIREDEKRRASERLDTLLLEGLAGTPIELTASEWKSLRQEALDKLSARKKSR
jgi:antitoxin ParD1/3/4